MQPYGQTSAGMDLCLFIAYFFYILFRHNFCNAPSETIPEDGSIKTYQEVRMTNKRSNDIQTSIVSVKNKKEA